MDGACVGAAVGCGVGSDCCCSSGPKGSEYCSSPAPWASAAAGTASRSATSAIVRRRVMKRASLSASPATPWRSGGRPPSSRYGARRMHILVLTDRDWTHPQGGGTGTNLYGQVSRWLAWGHRVTVVAGAYPGCAAREELAPSLTCTGPARGSPCSRARRGCRCAAGSRARPTSCSRSSTASRSSRRCGCGGRGWRSCTTSTATTTSPSSGARARWPRSLAETLPLRALYPDTTFLTISDAGRRDLRELGLAEDRIHVAYLGVEEPAFPASPSARAEPRLLYLGRLKQYKRIELLLDVLERVPAGASRRGGRRRSPPGRSRRRSRAAGSTPG